jgi:hypothetical protein
MHDFACIKPVLEYRIKRTAAYFGSSMSTSIAIGARLAAMSVSIQLGYDFTP